jgi:hypothetical protein
LELNSLHHGACQLLASATRQHTTASCWYPRYNNIADTAQSCVGCPALQQQPTGACHTLVRQPARRMCCGAPPLPKPTVVEPQHRSPSTALHWQLKGSCYTSLQARMSLTSRPPLQQPIRVHRSACHMYNRHHRRTGWLEQQGVSACSLWHQVLAAFGRGTTCNCHMEFF